jgi:dUTP pyrophosphatase
MITFSFSDLYDEFIKEQAEHQLTFGLPDPIQEKRSVLYVKKLDPNAKLPNTAHPGEDIAYDLYSIEDVYIPPAAMRPVRTGIAIQFKPVAGAIIGTRSGMAKNGFLTVGGFIDAGYRGEIVVMLRNLNTLTGNKVSAGDKIAQFMKVPVASDTIYEVMELDASARGEKGFGSTGA